MESSLQNRSIIADARAFVRLVGLAALLAGTGVAVYYAYQGLTLSHYDAKAHLVVARRILDGITPGWIQIGAVWLPLPHLLNMVPVQVDLFYRTGASGVAISVAAYAATAVMLTTLVIRVTGSRLAGIVGVLPFAANPSVLYLQSTPMTEPLLIALTTTAVWLSLRYFEEPTARRLRLAGWSVAAACLTRYEAWPVTACVFVIGGAALRTRGTAWREALRLVGRLAAYPAAAILAFLVLGRVSTGAWFVTSGFFVPDNIATGRPFRALLSVWWGAHELTSYPLTILAVAGLTMAAFTAWRGRDRGLAAVPLCLLAAAALPAFAYYEGHPFRIRYIVPLVPVVAMGVGFFVGLLRWRRVGALIALAAVLAGPRPLAPTSPMVLEAQWDRPNRSGRQAVTAYLRHHWNGEMVMASMGSLAHYMQELSEAGFAIRDFLHEGNGFIWDAALESPATHAEWLLIEERAEGGDMIAQRARAHPRYLDGFVRVAEGGGVALYRRVRTGT